MPRRAKENEENKNLEQVENKEVTSSVKATKKTTSKKSTTQSKTGKDTTKKVTSKKSATSKDSQEKVNSKDVAKKATSKSATSKTSTVKKTASKTGTTKKATTKRTASTTKKSTTKRTSTKKVSTKAKKRNINGKKAISPKLQKIRSYIVEYYDLPYRYNKTVVKALAQNPNTLFVYWEVSDEDRNSFIKKYGERFFHITKPVLIVHNLTDKYSYELDINDFANNWYIHVNDSKCQYVVELGRRPIEYTEEVPTDYIYITSSNVIEAPNDHVLFFNENDVIYFKNIHTNQYTKRVIKPFLKHICGIYKNFNLSEESNSFDFKNPSSQNPTSNVL